MFKKQNKKMKYHNLLDKKLMNHKKYQFEIKEKLKNTFARK